MTQPEQAEGQESLERSYNSSMSEVEREDLRKKLQPDVDRTKRPDVPENEVSHYNQQTLEKGQDDRRLTIERGEYTDGPRTGERWETLKNLGSIKFEVPELGTVVGRNLRIGLSRGPDAKGGPETRWGDTYFDKLAVEPPNLEGREPTSVQQNGTEVFDLGNGRTVFREANGYRYEVRQNTGDMPDLTVKLPHVGMEHADGDRPLETMTLKISRLEINLDAKDGRVKFHFESEAPDAGTA